MSKDGKRNAKATGKRVSKNGNVYYESRPNKSDKVTKKVKALVKKKAITAKQGIKALKSLAKAGKAI